MDPNPRVGEKNTTPGKGSETVSAKFQLKRRGKPGEENQQKFVLVQGCLFKRMHTNDGRKKAINQGCVLRFDIQILEKTCLDLKLS